MSTKKSKKKSGKKKVNKKKVVHTIDYATDHRVREAGRNAFSSNALQFRFAKNLRKARLDAGITQQELGAKISVAQTHICLLESGSIIPRLDTFEDLSKALKIDPASLLR